jgi:hypothetical protein
MRTARLVLSLVVLAIPSLAAAQDPAVPKFQFEKPPEKQVDWKVQAKGGFILTTGNSQTKNGTLTLTASAQTGADKISLEGMVAYGRSNIIVPVIDDATATVVALDRIDQTTTNEWRARGRYDRFLTANNSAYILGQIGADRIAGTALAGGGQAGYSRQVWKSDRQTLVAEVGYDLSFERYVQSPDRTIDPVTIHSARLFTGDLIKLSEDTGITASFEALLNLNQEKAPNASDPTGPNEVDAFKDTRLIAKAGLTTTLWKNLSFGFGFTLRYDQNPAPRGLPAGAKGLTFAPEFHPFAEKLDTLTEATLIFTFL